MGKYLNNTAEVKSLISEKQVSSPAAASYSFILRTHSIASDKQVLQSSSRLHSSLAHASNVSFPHVLFVSVSQVFSQLV